MNINDPSFAPNTPHGPRLSDAINAESPPKKSTVGMQTALLLAGCVITSLALCTKKDLTNKGQPSENSSRVSDPMHGPDLEAYLARYMKDRVTIVEGDYFGEEDKENPGYIVQYKKPQWTFEKWDVSEADRLNGISRRETLNLIPSAYRYFGYQRTSSGWASDGYNKGSNAWRAVEGVDHSGRIACFNLELRNGKLEVSPSSDSQNLMQVRPVRIPSAKNLTELEQAIAERVLQN
jgi:hypothetical protein